MKAIVWHDVGDIRLDSVPGPTVHDQRDAILRLTASAICGTDLLNLVAAGVVDPLKVLTQREPITDAITAYKEFDQRKPGWIKVELEPTKTAA